MPSLHARTRRLSGRSRPLRAFAAWACLPDSSHYGLGGPVTNIMAAKTRKTTKAKKAAVSEKLRAMVEDVERWPLSEQLLKTLDELDDGPGAESSADKPAPAATPKGKRRKKT
ncbi:hypothetical protein ACFODL_09245 [Phenylobacterium terrae]|uniref:Uncharacterized protein n=1 Tax=Phenylobacterium terrae TaxID=2665495 RepID=A0ABW4N5S3_9CAUL